MRSVLVTGPARLRTRARPCLPRARLHGLPLVRNRRPWRRGGRGRPVLPALRRRRRRDAEAAIGRALGPTGARSPARQQRRADPQAPGLPGDPAEDMEELFRVHCVGAFRCTRAALPFLRKAPKPVVVNVASRSVDRAERAGEFPRIYSYSIAKCAQNMLTSASTGSCEGGRPRVRRPPGGSRPAPPPSTRTRSRRSPRPGSRLGRAGRPRCRLLPLRPDGRGRHSVVPARCDTEPCHRGRRRLAGPAGSRSRSTSHDGGDEQSFFEDCPVCCRPMEASCAAAPASPLDERQRRLGSPVKGRRRALFAAVAGAALPPSPGSPAEAGSRRFDADLLRPLRRHGPVPGEYWPTDDCGLAGPRTSGWTPRRSTRRTSTRRAAPS